MHLDNFKHNNLSLNATLDIGQPSLITAANKVTVNIENLSPSITLALNAYCRVKSSPEVIICQVANGQ